MQPVLFVHGNWHGAWCWEERFVPWFRDHGYDARALTLRRHDQRHAPGLRLTRIRDYVADVAAAAAEMPSPPVVVGHSMGGFITQKYLEEHPAPAAVLVASIPPAGALHATLAIAARRAIREDGSLVRELVLDPTRDYQPLGTKSGPKPRVVNDVVRHVSTMS